MISFFLQSGHLLLAPLARAVNEEQQRAIEYLRAENQVLREKLGKTRIMSNADQRRRLAVKGIASYACIFAFNYWVNSHAETNHRRKRPPS